MSTSQQQNVQYLRDLAEQRQVELALDQLKSLLRGIDSDLHNEAFYTLPGSSTFGDVSAAVS